MSWELVPYRLVGSMNKFRPTVAGKYNGNPKSGKHPNAATNWHYHVGKRFRVR